MLGVDNIVKINYNYEYTHNFLNIKEEFLILGIREQKQLLTQKKILDVSKILFNEKGYKGVRTSEIAKLANIGEGTLFNYFRSKGELFLTALFENFDDLEYEVDKSKLISEEQIINEIVNVIDFFVRNAKQIDKKLLREYFTIIHNVSDSESVSTRQGQMDAEIVIMNNLSVLFNTLVESKLCEETIDIETAIKCIYGCSITVYNEFVFSDIMTYDSMMDTIRKQVRFILNGNITWKSIEGGLE